MFAHIFKNIFICDECIPSEIKMNFFIQDYSWEHDPDYLWEVLQYWQSKSKEEITFIKTSFPIFKRIFIDYCHKMGLSYEVFKLLLEYNDFYVKAIVHPYEWNYEEKNLVSLKKITEREYIYDEQHIDFDLSYIPFEYWVNMVKVDKFACSQFNTLNDFLSSKIEYIDPFKIDEYMEKDGNLGFDDEFSVLLFNKKLAKQLKKENYVIHIGGKS